jgi:hypothetical protein
MYFCDDIYVCETCGSDNIKVYIDGVCYCNDCDAPSTCVLVHEDE